MRNLTVELLKAEAKAFAKEESGYKEKSLYGVTDGKAVGTYLEHKFQETLQKKYEYMRGSSAKGIDFPKLEVDIKVTSLRQPQSSCPFKSARQKIYGLGYSLLVFVYEKRDDRKPFPDHQNGTHSFALYIKNLQETADKARQIRHPGILDILPKPAFEEKTG